MPCGRSRQLTQAAPGARAQRRSRAVDRRFFGVPSGPGRPGRRGGHHIFMGPAMKGGAGSVAGSMILLPAAVSAAIIELNGAVV